MCSSPPATSGISPALGRTHDAGRAPWRATCRPCVGKDNPLEATKGSLEPGKLADFAILSQDPTAVEPTTTVDIKVTETVKEGKTIFRLEPGARADGGVPDITPLLVAFGGHRGRSNDGCAHDAMFRMTAVMATSLADR